MPQGDPLSPLGLIVTLAEAVQSVTNLGCTQSVFLDDRILVALAVRWLLQGWHLWKRWSRRLGLVENENKVVALAQNGFHKYALLKPGFNDKNVRSQILLLGVDFVSRRSGEFGDSGRGIRELKHPFKWRLVWAGAPVPLQVRSALYRTRVIRTASFGWRFDEFPCDLRMFTK